jgi:hypothetical protein
MRALVPSGVYCEQLRVKTHRLMMEYIAPCVVAKVRDTFFIDTAGGVLYNFCISSHNYWLFLLLSLTVLRIGVLSF